MKKALKKTGTQKLDARALIKSLGLASRGIILGAGASKLLEAYDAVAPRTEKLYERAQTVLGRSAAFAAKSESVLPLLSQGLKHIMEAGSEIAKTKVQPFIQDIRDSRRFR